MSEKPACFQDPEVFEEDHPDCLSCDFFSPCRVLSKRNAKKGGKKSLSSSGSKSKNKKSGRNVVEYEVPVVDNPDMNFKDKLVWNMIRQTVSSTISEVDRAWNESIPRIKYTNILKHLEDVKKIASTDAEETDDDE